MSPNAHAQPLNDKDIELTMFQIADRWLLIAKPTLPKTSTVPSNLFPLRRFYYAMKRVLFATLLLCLFQTIVHAQARPEFRVSRGEAPKIDGDLSDEVWADDPLVLGDWVSYNPLYGTTMPQRTEVR